MNSLTLAYGLTKDNLPYHTKTKEAPNLLVTLLVSAYVLWQATNKLTEPLGNVSLSDVDYLVAEGLVKIAPNLASQRTLDLYR